MATCKKKRNIALFPNDVFFYILFTLSAPQHSTYLVIFDEGLVLDGPGVAVNKKSIELSKMQDKEKDGTEREIYLTDARRFEVIEICN